MGGVGFGFASGRTAALLGTRRVYQLHGADVLGRITGKHSANCARLAVVMASGHLFHVNQNIKQADGPPMLSSFQDDSG